MSAQPEHFNDDLARRIFPMRFRRIGNPYTFLNEVGIIPILEYIYKGNLLIDVAEVLNVSLTILRTWVEAEGHAPAVEEAETVSAEGFLAEGMRRLRTAETEFQLKQAREMIKHAQFMASKKNKKLYGNHESQQQGAGVSYVFNIGDQTSAPQIVKDVIQQSQIQQDPDAPPPRLSFNMLDHLVAPDIEADTPIGAIGWGDPEPETGPFYD